MPKAEGVALISQQRYLPFGGVRTNVTSPNSPNTDYGYTGQRNLDDDIGLMDYKARFYSPYLNRFIQPDTIVPETYNPQSLNKYSYTYNNPIRFTDSSGHCIDGISTIVCVMVVSAIVNVAIDYAVTTYVLEEEYTAQDAIITAGISIVTAGTGNFLTTAIIKSTLSTTSKFAAKILVQQGVNVIGNYAQREVKGIETTAEDVGVDIIGGTFSGILSNSVPDNVPYPHPKIKSILPEVEVASEVVPILYSGAYSITKKFFEKNKIKME
jgi:RHS repeat-associated protein